MLTKRRISGLLIVVLALALVSVAVAQMGPGMGRGWGMGWGMGWGGGMGWRGGSPGWSDFSYLASTLNLTDAQRQKAQAIFDNAYRQIQQLRDQMYEKRQAYWNSQKPMTDAEIDKRSAERADLMAQMQSTREKAFNNFYNNILTAEQRAKYNDLRASTGPGPRMGGRGCGRGRGWGWQ